MVRNVRDNAGYLFQRKLGPRVGGIEPTEKMCELRQAHHRMIYQSQVEQRIDGARGLALQNVDIDACVEQEL